MLKKILLVLLLIVVFVFLYNLTSKPNPASPVVDDQKADLILFVGNGCPHCKIVEDFIATNKIDTKISISTKEVYYNEANKNQMVEIAKSCPNIDTSQGIGVPLAFIKELKSCLQGDTPIIDYLKTK
jgi:glutaredoxin